MGFWEDYNAGRSGGGVDPSSSGGAAGYVDRMRAQANAQQTSSGGGGNYSGGSGGGDGGFGCGCPLGCLGTIGKGIGLISVAYIGGAIVIGGVGVAINTVSRHPAETAVASVGLLALFGMARAAFRRSRAAGTFATLALTAGSAFGIHELYTNFDPSLAFNPLNQRIWKMFNGSQGSTSEKLADPQQSQSSEEKGPVQGQSAAAGASRDQAAGTASHQPTSSYTNDSKPLQTCEQVQVYSYPRSWDAGSSSNPNYSLRNPSYGYLPAHTVVNVVEANGEESGIRIRVNNQTTTGWVKTRQLGTDCSPQ